MNLKQQLIDFGCGPEFVEIALGYAKFYKPELGIEAFIEFVEEEYAKVEEEIFKKAEKQIDASSLFGEFESEEEL